VKKRAPTKRHGRTRLPDSRWLLVGIVIYLGVAVTGVLVARSSQEMRTLYLAVEQNQGVRDQLLAQYSRLLLERSTLSSYQNVDEIAEQTLDMRFPERVERVTQ
jgi:cell division protein FtsL